jgi:hypothetical protein
MKYLLPRKCLVIGAGNCVPNHFLAQPCFHIDYLPPDSHPNKESFVVDQAVARNICPTSRIWNVTLAMAARGLRQSTE